VSEPDASLTFFRYALASGEQREALAFAPLPGALLAEPPRHSVHRDLYLDTADDTLRQRGFLCRLRVREPGECTVSLWRAETANLAERNESRVASDDVSAALAQDTDAGRRLRALVDPALMTARLELTIDRLARVVDRDLLRRPRLELYYDRVHASAGQATCTFHQLVGHRRRGSATALQRLSRELERQHDLQPIDEDPSDHARALIAAARRAASSPEVGTPTSSPSIAAGVTGAGATLLNAELSLLAFQRRVLALAEDPRTPLRARLRFLGIVTSNVDELYMVRMPALRRAARVWRERGSDDAAGTGPDGLTPRTRLELVEREIEVILAAQSRCGQQCLREAAAQGAHLVSWNELEAQERTLLRARFGEEIHPGLSPLAMTLSPGHPVPHLPHLGLSLAVVFRRTPAEPPHLAEIEIPPDVGRLLEVPGRVGSMITIEEVMRANVDMLHPDSHVEGAYLFRVTRAGELDLDEAHADDLLDAVARATSRRPTSPAVRVEVERTMPQLVRGLILEHLRRDAASHAEGAVDVVQVIDGLLDLRCLAALPLGDAPELDYPALPRSMPSEIPMFELARERDLLLHHPFDPFADSVVRFLSEAAADPDVTTIKITLYRVGDPSPVVEALLAAAQAGKKVVALVELKARFDEEHNVGWARALERAGGHVIYGLVGLKVHAKVALVVRREGRQLRRYVHVGTGNYSATSGRQYTDLSLFSTREALCADVAELFNDLSGSSGAPRGLRNGALIAPHQLLPGLLALIEREAEHARSGRPARIAVKVNGLADPEVIQTLYRAAEAGVEIELVVRGICTLRPGVPGMSDRIRVVSVVGRFLEHSRIYRFENDGSPEYFIGSSDLRPRNLRRRVELLVPVVDAEHRETLDRILSLYLDDPTGWELDGEGGYTYRGGRAPGAQDLLAASAAEQGVGPEAPGSLGAIA
jgi:polyphosphate kinase